MNKISVKSILQLQVIVFILFCLQIPLYSQTSGFIDGKVINSSTRKAVPFATVKLKNKELGVYANADGDFKIINIPEFQSDSLIISCIGFKRASVAFRDLSTERVNGITLSPSVYGLAEVKVQAKKNKANSFTIVSRAITSIKKNYPGNPFSYISYYRDYQKSDSNYLNLNEAIIQTMDGGFLTKSASNRYHLLDFRKNTDFPRIGITPYYDTDYRYGGAKNIPNAILGDQNGNELFILMVHDALRNFNSSSFSFINTFNENFLFNHEFSDPVAVYNNNLLLYRIPFSGRPTVTGPFLEVAGAIYIQPKDYTIHKLEYSCSYVERGKELKPMFNVDIEYGYENSVDSMMCLKYISFNNVFNVMEDKYFKIKNSYWAYEFWKNNELKKPVITIEFNRLIDTGSAARKENYEIKLGRKVAKIIDIKVKDKNKVLVELKDDNFAELRDSCVIEGKNIKDINGNILNKRKMAELYQYRELFVQEYNKKLPLSDNCYIQYLPLEQNCISKYTGIYNYWMNTPENIKK